MIKSIDKIIKIFVAISFILFAQPAFTQQLTLEDAWQLAKVNYPLIKKNEMIKESAKFSLQNVGKAFLPQFTINGQATYQSDVTSIPIAMPGINEMSKDQYRLAGEVSQLLYDGGSVNAQKEILKATEAVQLQNIEVSMQSVKERITDIYFGILLLEEQLAQTKLRRSSLEAALKKAEAAYKNGVSFKSNVTELKAEILAVNMNDIEIISERRAYMEMLSKITGEPIQGNTVFVKPATLPDFNAINRPEVKFFDTQKTVYEAQKKKLQADWMPKISAFAQGGYGRPGLNMLNNNFAPFALGGVRFSFPINNVYTWKNNLKIVELNQRQLEAEKEAFLINTNATLQKQLQDQHKYEALIAEDEKLIELRQEITKSAQAQLENNVITVSEFINKLNAEHQARQIKYMHQLQLLKAKYNYLITSGN